MSFKKPKTRKQFVNLLSAFEMYANGTKEEVAQMTASAFLHDIGWELKFITGTTNDLRKAVGLKPKRRNKK